MNEVISVQLFQCIPNNDFFDLPSGPARNAMVTMQKIDSGEAGSLNTLKALFNHFKDDRPALSAMLKATLSETSAAQDYQWLPEGGGIILEDRPQLIKKGKYRNIYTASAAVFRADKVIGDDFYFNIEVKNRVFFDQNLPLETLLETMPVKPNMWLPVIDEKNKFKTSLTSVQYKELYHRLPGKGTARYGEIFIRSGRLSEEEYDQAVENQEKYCIATTKAYGKARLYHYLARDLSINASSSIASIKKWYGQKEMPDEVKELIELWTYASKQIRELMGSKDELVHQLKNTLNKHFIFCPEAPATLHLLTVPRFHLVNKKKVDSPNIIYINDELDMKLNLGDNVVLYPSPNTTPEMEENFKGFFAKPTNKIGRAGFKFHQLIPFDQFVARDQAKALVDRVVEQSPDCKAALVAWVERGYLVNNKPLEFELIRRNIAVQHVIDQGKKLNAMKVSAVLKGMVEKFPVSNKPGDMRNSIAPFHYALGLDVSRRYGHDIAAFPVAYDRDGKIKVGLPDKLHTEGGEKRTEQEILDTINQVIVPNDKEPQHILFLRDGIAFEDYQAVADALPENVTLSVISVRKNLLLTTSEAFPEGSHFGVYAPHDDRRFLFGVNALRDQGSTVNYLHMAEVVLNPLKLTEDKLSEILIGLCCENKTNEAEIAGLPFPIAYADRMAGTIREFIQDGGLIHHVSNNYPNEVDKAGGPNRYIYEVIKSFIENRENGYSFAI